MSKARPHAHIYEKWVRGIRTAVPNAEERCGLYEYIIAYQLAKIYDAAELPQVQDLSSAAAVALAMLEGDLDELCEERKANNDKRRENGAQKPNSTGQTLAGAGRPLQSNTIQSNTIQSNTIQSNTIAKQALKDLQSANLSIFDLGLALLKSGYIVRYDQLQSIYDRARTAKSPVAYAAKALDKLADPTAGAICANFIEATGCKDAQALELYGVSKEGAILYVRGTAAAFAAIGEKGIQNAMQYAAAVGANNIQCISNGK